MLLKKQKKDLYSKVTKVLAKKIGDLIVFENYTGRDLSTITGVPENRLSEIKNGKTGSLTDEYLAAFVGKGVISLRYLKENIADLTAEEEKHLDGLEFYGNPELKKAILDAQKAGVDIIDIIKGLHDAAANRNT